MAKKVPKRSSIVPMSAEDIEAARQAAEMPEEDSFDGTPDARPQYKLTAAAYIDDVMLEPGRLIYYEGTPGWHMKAHNEKAKAVCKELWPDGRPEFNDPIQSLSILGKNEPTDSAKIMGAIAEQTAAMTSLAHAMTEKVTAKPAGKAA